MLNILNNEDISTLDKQIEQLIDFKPIPEHEVKQLCDKVLSNAQTIFQISLIFYLISHILYFRQRKSYQKKAMYNQ